MGETLGKRIVFHRKNQKLTQDQLAEQLGVTAQAVSKWENDQSCPDISLLPKIAAIFGITVDELLGAENRPVHQAEVVQEEELGGNGVHIQKGNWQFVWDAGRKGGLTFALFVLLVGSLALASNLLHWDVGFWSLLWPSMLLVYGISSLFSGFSILKVAVALFGGYSLVANIGIWEIGFGKELIFPACVVLFGLSLLFDALKKPKKPTFSVTSKGESIFDCNTVDGEFDCTLNFGKNTYLVNTPQLRGGDATASFGELTVDLSGCDTIAEDCAIEITCNFGQLTLLVPKKFQVDTASSTAFASCKCSGRPDEHPEGIIRLDASVSFGEINIQYI